eukprot:UN01138
MVCNICSLGVVYVTDYSTSQDDIDSIINLSNENVLTFKGKWFQVTMTLLGLSIPTSYIRSMITFTGHHYLHLDVMDDNFHSKYEFVRLATIHVFTQGALIGAGLKFHLFYNRRDDVDNIVSEMYTFWLFSLATCLIRMLQTISVNNR